MSQLTQGANFPSAILTVNRHEVDGSNGSQMRIVDGKLPDDLQGHLFILAAAGFADSPSLPNTELCLPSGDGTPLISGDGLIVRLDFHKKGQESQPGEVWLKTKLVGTPSYWADKATVEQPKKYGQLKFHSLGLARLSEYLGVRNVCNTSWLGMKFPGQNQRLLVTLDAGRSHEIDTESLEVVTPIGWNKEWIKQMELKLPFPLLMSSAHPYFDPRKNKNEVFTVNYSKSLYTLLLPSLTHHLEKPEEIHSTAEKFLKELEEMVQEAIRLIENFLECDRKAPWLIKKIVRTFISTRVIFLKNFSLSRHPQKLKEIGGGAKQIIIDELHDVEHLANLKEELEDFLQLIKLGLQVLTGAKDLQDVTYLVRWDGKGDLERWKLVTDDGKPVVIQETLHEIAVSENYVVLMDTSLKIGIGQLINLKNKKLDSFLRQKLGYAQCPDSYIYIVPRNPLPEGQYPARNDEEKEIVVKKVKIEREVFHFHVDYDDSHNQITLHAAHACAWDVGEWLRKEDNPLTSNPYPPIGMLIDGMDIGVMGRYVIDAEKGSVLDSHIISDPDYTWAVALYAYSDSKQGNDWWPPEKFENIYWNSYGAWEDQLSDYIFNLYANYKYRTKSLQQIKSITKKGKPSNLFRLDVQQMRICDRYQFDPGYYGNSPQFVPSANSTGGSMDGYITCTVNYNTDPSNSLESGQSEIWIFDAKNLNHGPICKLDHPKLKFPFTTHTTWLPQIAPRQPGLYCISVKKDFEEMVEEAAKQFPKVEAKIKELFEKEVYPHFPTCEEV
ncbi:MAG TPA: hypothetical protein DDZ80_25365 [Cyanobacteria bacterium UBA8803]|nr:hypothetical protein [Cyanobacteria bacterium UBA9273]HBL61624.1 hypothetical protein [Cyanobacteria bacterium UBA8803]